MQKQILKGINFIEKFSSKQTYLKAYAADLLFFFTHIANTSDDKKIRQLALAKGRKVAKHWRKYQRVPRKKVALFHTIIAEQAAHELGCIDLNFRQKLQHKLSLELVLDVLGFDPHDQPPPENLTDECSQCGLQNLPSRVFCQNCRKKLLKLSKYDVWLNAIVVTHHLHLHQLVGENLLQETLKWIDHMRPYPTEKINLQEEAWEATYAITHVIYALTNYSHRPVSREGLEAEHQYLISACQQAIECVDLDLLGECIDSLRSFDHKADRVIINNAIGLILKSQNLDGSWGNANDPAHRRMHTTWTAIDAIRGYRWAGAAIRLDEFLLSATTS